MANKVLLSSLVLVALFFSAALAVTVSTPPAAREKADWELSSSRKVAVGGGESRKAARGGHDAVADLGGGGEERSRANRPRPFPGCVPAELCAQRRLLCVRLCPQGGEEREPRSCPLRCIRCTPTC